MSPYKVLLTDYAWSEVEIERSVLGAANARLVVAPGTRADQLVQAAAGVDAIMTCWAQTTAQVIAAAARCRIVARLGIGLDNIDVDYCTRQGIPVTNVPDYCVVEVAEHALAMIFALARNLPAYHWQTKQGRYDLQSERMPSRVAGQTLGIVGLGKIGRCLAERALAVGMQVVATRRSAASLPAGVARVQLDELLACSDFVSLHLPLSEATRYCIAAKQLSGMKPTAYLINTARGPLVDHEALAAALQQGHLAGAALDVQDPEPPDLSQPPYNDPRVLVTPHAAFLSPEALAQLRQRAATQVATRLQGGIPENVVNPSVFD